VLSPEHPVGRHKAVLFRAALGFTRLSAGDVARAILDGLRTAEATVSLTDRHGTRYVVDMLISGPLGSAVVRTGWIIDHGETEPRFVTAYVRQEAGHARK